MFSRMDWIKDNQTTPRRKEAVQNLHRPHWAGAHLWRRMIL